jgi:hypothetical protein
MQRKVWNYSAQARKQNPSYDIVDPDFNPKPFHWEICAFPVMLSLDFKWTCARLRMLVWQQVSRLLVDPAVIEAMMGSANADSLASVPTKLAEAIIQADKSGSVSAQLELCKLLPIRMTTGSGEPLISACACTYLIEFCHIIVCVTHVLIRWFLFVQRSGRISPRME